MAQFLLKREGAKFPNPNHSPDGFHHRSDYMAVKASTVDEETVKDFIKDLG